MKEKSAVDIREAVYFMATGDEIQKSIQHRMNKLQTESAKIYEQLVAAVENVPEAVGLMVALHGMWDDLSPSALFAHGCISRINKCSKDLTELTLIARNIEADRQYQLSVDDARRFGLNMYQDE